MDIRKAKIEDLEKIVELNTDLFRHDYASDNTLDISWPASGWGRDYFRKSITNENSFTLVATENEEVVGYMIAALPETPDYMRKDLCLVEVENTFVIEIHRRQGIGENMYKEIEKWGRSQGANMMKITASYNNDNGRSFYKKMGLVETDVTFQKEL